jgi:hypothetical protein
MAVILDLEHSSTIEIAWKLGLITGAVYHFTCQYPAQVDVVTTLIAYTIATAVFLVVAFLPEQPPTPTGILFGLVIFNTIYVLPLKNTNQISLAVLLKLVYNIFLRHRGIPTTYRLSATDWGLWAWQTGGVSIVNIMQLHEELGTSPSRDDINFR